MIPFKYIWGHLRSPRTFCLLEDSSSFQTDGSTPGMFQNVPNPRSVAGNHLEPSRSPFFRMENTFSTLLYSSLLSFLQFRSSCLLSSASPAIHSVLSCE
jgi:hypothetical protein